MAENEENFLGKIAKATDSSTVKSAPACKSYHILYADLGTCENGRHSDDPNLHENNVGGGLWKIYTVYELARAIDRHLLGCYISGGHLPRI